MPALADLDPEARRLIQRAALAEIRHFRAEADPAAIEKLAEAGREACPDAPISDQVSEALEEIAADLREQQRQMAAAAGSLGALVRLMVRS